MRKRINKGIAWVLSVVLIFSLTSGCFDRSTKTSDSVDISTSPETILPTETEPEIPKIGISMPNNIVARWELEGSEIKKMLETAGYQVDLQFAGDDPVAQDSQIQKMLADGCSVLLVAPVLGADLQASLDQAKAGNIPVVSYDRLISGSDAVTHCVTFDMFASGAIQGTYIETALDLPNAEGPFNLEIFSGDPEDASASLYFSGAMSVLQPYIDSGKLTVLSGRVDFLSSSIKMWDTKNAYDRMISLLTVYYSTGEQVDAILSASDAMAVGVASAFEKGGYTVGEDWPIVTGQDCELQGIQNILSGKQSMSFFRDTRALPEAAANIIQSIVNSNSIVADEMITVNGGATAVPAVFGELVYVDKENIQAVLVDSGYYSESDLTVSPDTVTESAEADPLTGEITILSYLGDVEILAIAFMKEHPNVTINYQYAPIDGGEYERVLEETINGDASPDVIVLDNTYAKTYIESDDILMDLSEFKQRAEALEIYPYLMDVNTDSSTQLVRAYSLVYYPTVVFYRNSLAEKLLGTDDPEEIQAMMADMEQFTKMAETIHEKSNGKTYALSTFEDLFLGYLYERTSPWLVDNQLNIDPQIDEYIDVSKSFVEKGYTFSDRRWAMAWYDGLSGARTNEAGESVEVFSYIVPSYMYPFVFPYYSTKTKGDWRVAVPPMAGAEYGWSLGIPQNANNADIAKEFIAFVTLNEQTMANWATGEYDAAFVGYVIDWGTVYLEKPAGEFIASKKVAEKIVDEFDSPKLNGYFGGQNYYRVYLEAANMSVRGDQVQSIDYNCSWILAAAVSDYCAEISTRDGTLLWFENRLFEIMP